MKFLFVEDQFIIVELLTELAISLQLNFDVTDTAEKALHLVKNHQFDVVITDYILPGMNGADLTKVILKEKAATQVYLCTSSLKAAEMEQFLALGGLGVIDKPLTKSKLEKVIKQAHPKVSAPDSIHQKYLPKYVKFLTNEMHNLEQLNNQFLTKEITSALHRAIHGIKGAADVMNDHMLSDLCGTILKDEYTDNSKQKVEHLINKIHHFITLNHL